MRVMAMLLLRPLLAFWVVTLTFTGACAAMPTGTAQELLKQLRQDVPDVRDCEPAHGLPFTAREMDLGSESGPHYLLTSTPDCMCGQVNCSEWLYRRGPQKWELILETQGYSFTTRPTVHHGYRDVETRSRDSAARVDTLRYAFDGHVYRAAAAAPPVAQAAGAGTAHRVQFLPGTSSIQLQGTVSSRAPQRWTLGARKAQTLQVSLGNPENSGVAFSVLGPPGPNGRPLTASTKRWEGALPETGTYTVLVEAPPHGLAAYTLSIAVR
jgi:hypothetical protein